VFINESASVSITFIVSNFAQFHFGDPAWFHWEENCDESGAYAQDVDEFPFTGYGKAGV